VDELAFHVVNLAIAVNPARIAVGGGITRSWDRISPRLEEALRNWAPYPPDLVLGHFPQEAPLLGAVALAVDAAADPASAHVVTVPSTPGPDPSHNGSNKADDIKGLYRDKRITPISGHEETSSQEPLRPPPIRLTSETKG
jgi:hypothetical protein